MNLIEMVPVVLRPEENAKLLKPSIEVTGNGELLCFDGFAGRWFRSSEECVRKAIDEFIEAYARKDYISWNDLHNALGISETHFGAEYGYPGNDDYRNIDRLEFDITLMDEEDNFENMGESVLIFEPSGEYCYPMEFFMEV